jgi:hypothetical protein
MNRRNNTGNVAPIFHTPSTNYVHKHECNQPQHKHISVPADEVENAQSFGVNCDKAASSFTHVQPIDQIVTVNSTVLQAPLIIFHISNNTELHK